MRRCAVERRFHYFASVVVKEKSKPESETAVEGFVCGGHYAAKCSACPWKGRKWKGSRWCNGGSEWSIAGGRGTCVLPPAPTPPAMAVMDGTSSTRGTVTVRSTEGTMTQFSTSARSSEVQDALRHVLGAYDGGFTSPPWICSMCAVSCLIACAAPMRAISNRSKRGTKKLSMVCPGNAAEIFPRPHWAENDAGLLNIIRMSQAASLR